MSRSNLTVPGYILDINAPATSAELRRIHVDSNGAACTKLALMLTKAAEGKPIGFCPGPHGISEGTLCFIRCAPDAHARLLALGHAMVERGEVGLREHKRIEKAILHDVELLRARAGKFVIVATVISSQSTKYTNGCQWACLTAPRLVRNGKGICIAEFSHERFATTRRFSSFKELTGAESARLLDALRLQTTTTPSLVSADDTSPITADEAAPAAGTPKEPVLDLKA